MSNITKFSGLNSVIKYIQKQKINSNFDRLLPTEKHNATKFNKTQVLLSNILASLVRVKGLSSISNFSNDPLIKKNFEHFQL